MGSGILYSVAVPIGNSEDLSLRAKTILMNADFIACEDTRKARDMLRRAGIETSARLLSHHSHNEKASADGLIHELKNGRSVALVSDAGTPRVSDPGFSLVQAAFLNSVTVSPVPGPSALTAMISVAPLAVEPLVFLGFLPVKPGKRDKQIEKFAGLGVTLGLYESVHRIQKTLDALLKIIGNKTVFIGREITKVHEEFFTGTLVDAIEWAKNGKKGEFCLLVDTRDPKNGPNT